MSSRNLVFLFFVICFIFSFLIMFKTFSYSQGNILIDSKLWSDFASHIPLIRSFTFGWNFPIEYPLFPGEPIHYHFLFYAFVGLLEKIGIPLNFALNVPSAIGFFALILILYFFSKQLFSSKIIGILAVIFFLFNGSFSFIYFIQDHPPTTSFLKEIIENKEFISFAPYYGEGIVSAFWNLNIYTNQRHLAAAFALSLFIIYFLLKPILNPKKKLKNYEWVILGITLGLSFYFHIAVFMMTGFTIAIIGLLFPEIRKNILLLLFAAAVISLPQYIYMSSGGEAFGLVLKPGYLIYNQLSVVNFLWYWLMNLGLHSILIILGFIFANRIQRKIFFAFFSMFVIGNFLQFSPEIAANHKFFNYFMLIGVMYSASVLVRLLNNIFLKPIFLLLFFILIFSGIIDLFPILNDQKVKIYDYPNDKTVRWIVENTPPGSIFLNSTYLFTPESLAGRKVFLGWPYFAWSAGHDTNERGEERVEMFSSNSREEICKLLKKNDLQYISINRGEQNDSDIVQVSDVFENQFYLEHKSEEVEIYNSSKSCPNW